MKEFHLFLYEYFSRASINWTQLSVRRGGDTPCYFSRILSAPAIIFSGNNNVCEVQSSFWKIQHAQSKAAHRQADPFIFMKPISYTLPLEMCGGAQIALSGRFPTRN